MEQSSESVDQTDEAEKVMFESQKVQVSNSIKSLNDKLKRFNKVFFLC